MRAYWEQTREQSGRSQKHASYWLCVLLLRQYLFFTLLRRHIFVFFTRSFSLRPLLCSLSLACCYLVAHIVGLREEHRRSPRCLGNGQGTSGNPRSKMKSRRTSRLVSMLMDITSPFTRTS